MPKLYDELASWWPLLSPPADYEDEAAFYGRTLAATCERPPLTLSELGSGGGNNASSTTGMSKVCSGARTGSGCSQRLDSRRVPCPSIIPSSNPALMKCSWRSDRDNTTATRDAALTVLPQAFTDAS